MKYTFLFCLTLFSCAHSTTPARVPPSAEPSATAEEGSRLRTLEVSSKRAQELFHLLQTIGLKAVKVGQTSYISAFDLACSLNIAAQNTDCEYFTLPPEMKSRKKIVVKGKAANEDLRLFLSLYPVEQGDAGAITHFAQCRKYSYPDGSMLTDCYLAIQLNYEGP